MRKSNDLAANPREIWLATNGNDVNSGLTQALPKKTLNGAIVALTATCSTIHVSRNIEKQNKERPND